MCLCTPLFSIVPLNSSMYCSLLCFQLNLLHSERGLLKYLFYYIFSLFLLHSSCKLFLFYLFSFGVWSMYDLGHISHKVCLFSIMSRKSSISSRFLLLHNVFLHSVWYNLLVFPQYPLCFLSLFYSALE